MKIFSLVIATALLAAKAFAADPLPSWNDTASKQSIIQFVEKVTTPGSRAFIATLTQRARDYLFANLDQPFSLRELSEAISCSERLLQYALREVYGVSPQGWFQAMKLNEANRELRAHGPGEISVTDVALRWGFTHLGRFSVEYRRMFAEHPSETLKRGSRTGRRNEEATVDSYRAIVR